MDHMDVNEHERLLKITLRHKFKQGNSVFITVRSAFQSHIKVFYSEHNSYTKTSVKQPLACSWACAVLFTSADN